MAKIAFIIPLAYFTLWALKRAAPVFEKAGLYGKDLAKPSFADISTAPSVFVHYL